MCYNTQRLYCNNKCSKITERTKKRKENTYEGDTEENIQFNSGNSKFSVINIKNLFSKITLGKIRSARHQQANSILNDSSNSEALSAKSPPIYESSDADLLDLLFSLYMFWHVQIFCCNFSCVNVLWAKNLPFITGSYWICDVPLFLLGIGVSKQQIVILLFPHNWLLLAQCFKGCRGVIFLFSSRAYSFYWGGGGGYRCVGGGGCGYLGMGGSLAACFTYGVSLGFAGGISLGGRDSCARRILDFGGGLYCW